MRGQRPQAQHIINQIFITVPHCANPGGGAEGPHPVRSTGKPKACLYILKQGLTKLTFRVWAFLTKLLTNISQPFPQVLPYIILALWRCFVTKFVTHLWQGVTERHKRMASPHMYGHFEWQVWQKKQKSLQFVWLSDKCATNTGKLTNYKWRLWNHVERWREEYS